MIYLDSAAVVKLVRQEACSADLVSRLNTHDDVPLASSALVEVEVPGALRRSAPQALIGVPAAVGRLFRLEIDSTIRATAAAFARSRRRRSSRRVCGLRSARSCGRRDRAGGQVDADELAAGPVYTPTRCSGMERP
ncbi:hypothetical protein AB0C02_24955 [Micromonospora sp. NPDC048999]|uniref:hypothetical protein n=1 Tax=Micromonospora sp. NPDC048999 TaxID=3155391 RepID=UPI0033F995FA